MKILASYNIKGGVGKTATAVNIAYLASRDGYRVLLWDLDPQGAASFYFRIKPKVKGGSKGLLSGKRELDELIKGSDFPNLDVLPADFSYRHIDLLLDEHKKPTKQLRKLIKPLAADYDLLLFDCPPSISLASEAVFAAADLLLVPVIPTHLSQRTLDQLREFRSREGFDRLEILPFCSLVDRRKGLHRQFLVDLPQQYPELLPSHIPYASEVEQMGVQRLPLQVFAGHSRAAEAFRSLWRDVRRRIDPGGGR